jgi:MscS family membrane protein
LYFCLLFLYAALLVNATHAQSLPGSGSTETSPTTVNTRQEPPGFADFFESFGQLLTRTLRDLVGLRGGSEKEAWDSTASPRDSLMTFLNGMDALKYEGSDNLERVQQTLPTGFSPDSDEALALKSVLDRLGNISPIDIPGEAINDEEPRRTHYEVFPYGLDHHWVWEVLEAEPKGSIVMERTSQQQWRFSAASLEGAPQLLDSIREISPVLNTKASEELALRVLTPMFERTPWWGWLVLLVSMVAAVFVGWVVRKAVIWTGNKLEEQTRPVIGSMMRSIGTSLAILTATVVFVLGSGFVEFSPLIERMHWTIVKVILVIAFVWLFFGISDLAGAIIRRHIMDDGQEYGAMSVTIIQRVLHAFVFVILLIFIFENILGLNIGALITGLGIIGLALSLAGKESAQNLFGAVSIFMNRPFVVGDWVCYKDDIGEVEDVRMQSTHIRLLSGEMLVIPNMQFVSNEVENLAMRKYLRREMNITLPYGTPPDKVKQAMDLLDEVLRSDDIIDEGKCNLEDRPPLINFSDFGDYYLNIKVYYWYFIGDEGKTMQRNSERGWFSYLEHCSLVNQAVLKAFDQHDIEFAYPTQTIDLRTSNQKDEMGRPGSGGAA